mgnify:CR=1 FL=1|jgi:hypothetical protein
MKNYKIEYMYLAFGGQDLEGYEFDNLNVDAISPKQAIAKAKLLAPPGAKKFTITN